MTAQLIKPPYTRSVRTVVWQGGWVTVLPMPVTSVRATRGPMLRVIQFITDRAVEIERQS